MTESYRVSPDNGDLSFNKGFVLKLYKLPWYHIENTFLGWIKVGEDVAIFD